MLHINYFKFGLKQKTRTDSLLAPSETKNTPQDITQLNESMPIDQPDILVTIGPKSEDISSIKEISKYTKFFRLNGSHNTIDWHVNVAKSIREACPTAMILLDIPGIKPRTNNPKAIKIKKDETVHFSHGLKSVRGGIKQIPLTNPLPKVNTGVSSFSLSDGSHEFDLLDHTDSSVYGKSKEDFQLLPKKGLNIPASIYNDDLQIEVYLKFLEKVKKVDFDAVGLSFVQNSESLKAVRKIFQDKLLVSKIENKLGVKNREEITKCSDMIMIDRGDLFAEVGITNFYQSIMDISYTTKSYGRPLIMATENLDSMRYRLQPSKSEIIALQHSIEIGSDLLMLSDETATSDLYMNTIRWLNTFLRMH